MSKHVIMAFQMALASFVSFEWAVWIQAWLPGEPEVIAGLWAIISAVFVLQDSHEEAVQTLKIRFMGSILGGFASVLIFCLLPINIAGIVIGIFLISLGCESMGWGKYTRLSCITFTLILLVYSLSSKQQPLMCFAFWRLLDSVIGSLVAFGVRWVFLWKKI